MYVKYWRRLFARVGVGAALLRLLGTCQEVLLWVTPGALDDVWTFNGRTGELPGEAALYFCCKGRGVFLGTEGALKGNATETKKFPTYAPAQDHYGDCIHGLILFVTDS